MQWVKANERLPEMGGYYFIKAGLDKALWTRRKLIARVEYLKKESVENHIQWLDESPLQEAAPSLLSGNEMLRMALQELPTNIELELLDNSIWAADPREEDVMIKDLKSQINKITNKVRAASKALNQ